MRALLILVTFISCLSNSDELPSSKPPDKLFINNYFLGKHLEKLKVKFIARTSIEREGQILYETDEIVSIFTKREQKFKDVSEAVKILQKKYGEIFNDNMYLIELNKMVEYDGKVIGISSAYICVNDDNTIKHFRVLSYSLEE